MLAEVRPNGLIAPDACGFAFAGDPRAPHVAPRDADRGLRTPAGERRWRGPHRGAGWLPSAVHYLLLDDPRTAAVGTCRAGRADVVDLLARHGFARGRRLTQAAAQPLWMCMPHEAFFSGRHV